MRKYELSLILPTRQRVHLLRRLFQSIVDNSEDLSSFEIVLCVDEDDTESAQVSDDRLNIQVVVMKKTTMGFYNTHGIQCASSDLFVLINDDLTIETRGWDKLIKDKANSIDDGIFLLYPTDSERPGFPTFPIISRKTFEVLVDPYPAEYENLYIDTHIHDIFLRLEYLGYKRYECISEVIFDHRHFIDGEVRPDAIYINKNRYRDYLMFIRLREYRQHGANRLSSAITKEELPEYKKIICEDVKPDGLLSVFTQYSLKYLLDPGLPLWRRIISFLQFAKYYAAVKSGFTIFGRKSYSLYRYDD